MRAVIAVCSNKGGVGKTTVATNLAIYLRALHEDLPVLLVGLDDQSIIERMFRLQPRQPGEGNLKHAFAEHSLERVIQTGQYGVQFVPPPPDVELLKARCDDPSLLRRMLDRLDFPGVAIVDTKSDLEALTRSALHAADLAILPVSDWASLEEATKVLGLLERTPLGDDRGRILLTLVDRRTRIDESGRDLYERLVGGIDERGWRRFGAYLSAEPAGRGPELGHPESGLDPPPRPRHAGVHADACPRRGGDGRHRSRRHAGGRAVRAGARARPGGGRRARSAG